MVAGHVIPPPRELRARAVMDGVWSAVMDGVWPAVMDGVWPAVMDGVWPAVMDGVWPAVMDGVWSPTVSALLDQDRHRHEEWPASPVQRQGAGEGRRQGRGGTQETI